MPPALSPREEEARLTGARAEFAGTLPRRLETLRAALAAAEQLPGDADRIKGLLRRVHAVGSAARVLGFASVAEALAEAERSVRQAEAAGKPAPFEEVSRAFDVLPSLVLGAPVSQREPDAVVRTVMPAGPTSVLVLGPATLAQALEELEGAPPVECERVADPARLVELAHIVDPDVVVVDGDQPGARDAIAKLFAEPLLAPCPVVVVGSFEQPESAAAFVELGVALVLPKPVSPDALRRAVDEVRERAARPRPVREPLGELTVAALAERIAGEFKRGLVDALETSAPNARVSLGDGHDVLAAVWGAVARVRELVTLRSNGGLRFEPSGPEGGVPFAPWGGGERRAGERGTARGRELDRVSLHGRRIVVADDDPAVVWFMAEILRSVGVEVLEAHDGKRALELAFESWPDAVVSDVLMPKLDGFSLCHELKRDVILRDVPVILLSWKEDLLQRVRELGADADGYLRKEATASAVLERVREILRARSRVEERIEAGGEVRGRLDGLTPRLVLDLACRGERSVRVSLRDAAFLFEAQVRKGRLVSVTRSAQDGSFLRGSAALGSLLGVAAGRFSVEPDASACRNELSGSLFEILKEPVALARASLAAVSAGALVRLERVELERPLVEAYLACTPEPAAGVVRRLLAGQSPLELVVSGAVSGRLLEVVLSDIARRGGVLSFTSSATTRSAPPPALVPEPAGAPVPLRVAPTAESEMEAADAGWFEHEAVAQTVALSPLRVEGTATSLPFDDHPTPVTEGEPTFNFGVDSSTLDGLGQNLPPVAPEAPRPEPTAPEDDLGAHVLGVIGESPANREAAAVPDPGLGKTLQSAAYPPDPTTPAAAVSEPPVVVTRLIDPAATLRSSDPPQAFATIPSEPPAPAETDSKRLPTEPPQRVRLAGKAPARVEKAPAQGGKAPPQAPTGSMGTLLFRSAIAGALAFGVTTWLLLPLFGNDKESVTAPAAEKAEPELPPTTSAAAAASAAPVLGVDSLDPPPGIELSPGQGIIEVEAPGPDPIYVDDAFVGLGPLRRVAAPAGPHRIEMRGGPVPRKLDITLDAGRRAHVALLGSAPPVASPGLPR